MQSYKLICIAASFFSDINEDKIKKYVGSESLDFSDYSHSLLSQASQFPLTEIAETMEIMSILVIIEFTETRSAWTKPIDDLPLSV